LSTRQIGSELKMLAAGLVLGRLAVHKPRAPAPAVVRIAEPAAKPRRKRDFLTNNAVVAGVVSAIVAGVISFLVAHYQTQDADRQAVSQASANQQVVVAGQVETAATKFDEDVYAAFNWNASCFKVAASKCLAEKPDMNAIFADMQTLNNLLNNISSQAVSATVLDLEADVQPVVTPQSSLDSYLHGEAYLDIDYADLMTLCGQIIQGQS
jgi:hypothetical protein